MPLTPPHTIFWTFWTNFFCKNVQKYRCGPIFFGHGFEPPSPPKRTMSKQKQIFYMDDFPLWAAPGLTPFIAHLSKAQDWRLRLRFFCSTEVLKLSQSEQMTINQAKYDDVFWSDLNIHKRATQVYSQLLSLWDKLLLPLSPNLAQCEALGSPVVAIPLSKVKWKQALGGSKFWEIRDLYWNCTVRFVLLTIRYIESIETNVILRQSVSKPRWYRGEWSP